ncbi:MAG: hypothetical protein GY947_19270 [Rhodobacteraceae bacterium]|nr:hypothetical protein [Paracoccaceae bacterium]
MLSTLIAGTLASAAVIIFALLGGSNALGAHHFWAVKTAVVGAPAGAVLAIVLWLIWRTKRPRVILFALLVLACFTLAHFGKTQFAASYGDDVLAGKLWYFGWIATSGAVAGLLTSILGRGMRIK